MEIGTIEDYLQDTEENFEWVRKGLRLYLEQEGKIQKEIPKLVQEHAHEKGRLECDVSDISQPEVTRFMKNSKDGGFAKIIKNHRYFVQFVYEKKVYSPNSKIRVSDEDSFYHALTLFLGVWPQTETNIKNRAQGVYKVYRYSTILPKKVVLGASEITYDKNTKAIVVKEVYGYSGEKDTKDKIGFCPIKEEYSGYMSKTDSRYMIFSRDTSGSAMQMTLLTHTARPREVFNTMKGVMLGVLGDVVFSTNVYYERYTGSMKELAEKINIYDTTSVPEVVMTYLNE